MQDDYSDYIESYIQLDTIEDTNFISNSPEKNLHVAVIARAIQDWIGKDLNLAEAAKEWFYEPILEEPRIMSFQYICDILDLDYIRFRTAIVSYVKNIRGICSI